jgi:peptidoglycan/xylan/chitin deacetylase (PgdA/CDA1 family)
MARIEQQKADERVLQLLEKHNVRTSFFMLIPLSFLLVYMHPNLIWVPKLKQEEVILNKILQLDMQVDEKQKLEIDIEQLKGKLVVVM